MLKRHNIKPNNSRISFNSSGKVSCLLLLFLTFLLINPTTTSASALESKEDENYNSQVSTQADSGVTISFTPASGSASLTPTTSDGASAKINISANVKIASTGGYTIYLGGKNSALTGTKTGQTIPAATTATTFANMKTNTWGYAYAEGSSVSDAATYSALPQGQGISLSSVSGNNTNINRTFALSFAAKIGNDKPADTYSNQVTLSVTSSPKQITTWAEMTEMQQMTSAICSNATTGVTKQLKDTRDGKYYWVSKLADGKCWMTQNLALDITTAGLSALDTDIINDWNQNSTYPPTKTETSGVVSSDWGTNAATKSWNLGNYVIKKPNSTSLSNYCKNITEGSTNLCDTYFINVSNLSPSTNANFYSNNSATYNTSEYDAHYLVGNYYQWNTATAGTGGNITSGTASGSICPKGWRLPTGAVGGEYDNLLTAGKIGSKDSSTITSPPYYFVEAGRFFSDNSAIMLYLGGSAGHLWTSTASNSTESYLMYFFNNTVVGSASIYSGYAPSRKQGMSVRCIAR